MNSNKKNEKIGSPTFILAIFACLIVFIFVVPYLYERYNKEIKSFFGSKDEEEVVESEPERMAVSDLLKIGSDGSIVFNEITLSNMVLNGTKLLFDIESKESVDLGSLNYYVEFYKNKTTFIARRSLSGSVNGKAHIDVNVNGINIDDATYIQLSHISDDSIPKSVFPSDESGLASFTCKNGSYEYTYEFLLDKLFKVTKKYTYMSSDLDEYASELLKYQKYVNEYNDLDGVTASLAEIQNTMVYILEVDYETAKDYNDVIDKYSFKKDVLDNVVKFKMESMGFDCR